MKHIVLTLTALFVTVGAMAQSSNRIYIEDFEIDPDSTLTVPVMLANEDPSRGVQFYITLPEGLKMTDYDLTDYSRRHHMAVSCNFSSKNNCYMVFIYPSLATCFPPDTVAVMTIEFHAPHDFEGGLMPVWKCRGSTMENKSIFMEDGITRVTVPQASLIGDPVDRKPAWREDFINQKDQP